MPENANQRLKIFMNNFNKKEGSIPDEDIWGWMKSLREGGMSEEEIDLILEKANYNYRKARGHLSIGEELEIINREYLKKYGRSLSKDEIEYFKKGLEIKRKKD